MGRSIGQGFPQSGSSDAFFGGGQNAPTPSPGAGGRPAIPGGPRLPQNPYAEAAWRLQLARGAMGIPKIK